MKLLLPLLLFLSLPLAAADVVLEWDPNTESDLAGYKVYLGTASRTYGPPTTLPGTPATPTYTVSGLLPGVTYYFAVTAYNTAGLESGYSNEVFTTVGEEPAVLPPTGLAVTREGDTLHFSWASHPQASSLIRFRLFHSLTSGVFPWNPLYAAFEPGTRTSGDAPMPAGAGPHYFALRAVGASDSLNSEISNEVTIPAAAGCDVNADGAVNILDLQLLVNAVLSGASSDVDGDGSTDVRDVQIVVNVILGQQPCP